VLAYLVPVTDFFPTTPYYRSLLEPIRKIAARVSAHFLQGAAQDIDFDSKLIEVKDRSTGKSFYVPYDKLVISVGATSMTHGVEGLENTYQLKTI
jgi:NADH dehydrogenase